MAFAYDHIVQARLRTLMVLDKGQHKVFLRFWVDQMIVGLVIPLEGFDVVNVEFDWGYVSPTKSGDISDSKPTPNFVFHRESRKHRGHEDKVFASL